MQALIGQVAFVLLTPFIKGGRGDFIPLSEIPHCPLCQRGRKARTVRLDSRWSLPPNFLIGGGNDRCYKNLDDDGFWFSFAITHLRGHGKRKASGFAGGYLLNNRPGYFLIYWIP